MYINMCIYTHIQTHTTPIHMCIYLFKNSSFKMPLLLRNWQKCYKTLLAETSVLNLYSYFLLCPNQQVNAVKIM